MHNTNYNRLPKILVQTLFPTDTYSFCVNRLICPINNNLISTVIGCARCVQPECGIRKPEAVQATHCNMFGPEGLATLCHIPKHFGHFGQGLWLLLLQSVLQWRHIQRVLLDRHSQ